jgi:hypothetical protein
MLLPNGEAVERKFVEERVTPQVVPCLTDQQLAELGISTLGDRTSLRQRCQRCAKGGSISVKDELPAVMQPSSATSRFGYNPHEMIPRRGKGKRPASRTSATPKGKCSATFKNLQSSATEEEVECLFDSPEFAVLMELSGSRRVPCLSTKDALAQDFILHDALLRGKSALDQIAQGMIDVGVLSLIRLFPVEFETLFTHQYEDVTAAVLLDLMRFPESMNEKEVVTAAWLAEFIKTSDTEELCRLLTGSEQLPAAGYSPGYMSVNFIDSDAIIGATCQLKLTLPTNFNSYDDLKRSLLAVLPDGRKAFTMI